VLLLWGEYRSASGVRAPSILRRLGSPAAGDRDRGFGHGFQWLWIFRGEPGAALYQGRLGV